MRLNNRFLSFFIALLILAIAGCASSAKKRGTGEYIDDAAITAKVKTAIVKAPDLKATQISVETYKGAVQLGGFVDSRESANRAIEVARSVGGVKSVQNNMSLR